MTSIDDPEYQRDDWPLNKRDLDAIYYAIRNAQIANRTPTEVQTPLSRISVLPEPDWRLFGITWIATEFLNHNRFRLLYSQGEHTEHAFIPRT